MSTRQFIVRNEKSGEREEIHKAKEAFFGLTREQFTTIDPTLYGKLQNKLGRYIVAEADGKLVGLVGIFPEEIRIGGCLLKNARIGGICTLPEARGKGVMSALLNEANRQMIHEGFDVSFLGGDRLRYTRYGWEMVGYARQLSIPAKYIKAAGIEKLPVRKCKKHDDRDKVKELHKQCPWGSVRPGPVFFARLERQNTQVFCSGLKNNFIYGAVQIQKDSASVEELLGDASSAPGFLLSVMRKLSIDFINVKLPDFNNSLRTALLPYTRDYFQSPVRQAQIVNLSSFLKKITGLLEKKLSAIGWHGSFCLAIPERKQYITLTRKKGERLDAKSDLRKPCLNLDLCSASALILGRMPGEFQEIQTGEFKVLTHLFPLEWFYYYADNA